MELQMGQQVRIVDNRAARAGERHLRWIRRARVTIITEHTDHSRTVEVKDMTTGAPYWYPADPQFWVERHGIAEYHV